MIGRREFIAGLGGTVAWPLAARAQQPERKRRVGVLMFLGVDDPVAQSDVVTFQQAMRELGWTEGRNLTIDYRWGATVPIVFAISPDPVARCDCCQ